MQSHTPTKYTTDTIFKKKNVGGSFPRKSAHRWRWAVITNRNVSRLVVPALFQISLTLTLKCYHHRVKRFSIRMTWANGSNRKPTRLVLVLYHCQGVLLRLTFPFFSQEYVGFILSINEAVQGKKTSSLKPYNDKIGKVVSMLDSLDSLIDETPPTDQPQRFGNKAFRDWFQKLQNVCNPDDHFHVFSSINQLLFTWRNQQIC